VCENIRLSIREFLPILNCNVHRCPCIFSRCAPLSCLRHTAYGVPHPELALVAGFALQFAGAVLLLLDVHLLVAAI
jgi:hypothetical protein